MPTIGQTREEWISQETWQQCWGWDSLLRHPLCANTAHKLYRRIWKWNRHWIPVRIVEHIISCRSFWSRGQRSMNKSKTSLHFCSRLHDTLLECSKCSKWGVDPITQYSAHAENTCNEKAKCEQKITCTRMHSVGCVLSAARAVFMGRCLSGLELYPSPR